VKRVLVIGSGGSGKTTFARRLAQRSGLPLIHLDSLYWKPGWEPTPAEEWRRRVDVLLRGPAWIMDGNYGGTLDARIAACDAVVFLDIPRLTCLWRVMKRQLRHRGEARPEMPAGCPERMTWEFISWIWTYPKRRRPAILSRLAKLQGEKRAVILRSSAGVDRFLNEWPIPEAQP
jgi:adenylate kinase family enzyme